MRWGGDLRLEVRRIDGGRAVLTLPRPPAAMPVPGPTSAGPSVKYFL